MKKPDYIPAVAEMCIVLVFTVVVLLILAFIRVLLLDVLLITLANVVQLWVFRDDASQDDV